MNTECYKLELCLCTLLDVHNTAVGQRIMQRRIPWLAIAWVDFLGEYPCLNNEVLQISKRILLSKLYERFEQISIAIVRMIDSKREKFPWVCHWDDVVLRRFRAVFVLLSVSHVEKNNYNDWQSLLLMMRVRDIYLMHRFLSVIGNHAEHKNLYVFNGLGARGILNGCYFSKSLYDFIEEDVPLHEEVSINRFK